MIGYHDQGESVVFFIKTDGMVAYTGLVDCYKTEEQNAVKMVLEKERIKKVDFVCWTPPHDDYTRGLDEIWKGYCTKEKMKIMYLKDATQVERLERQI